MPSWVWFAEATVGADRQADGQTGGQTGAVRVETGRLLEDTRSRFLRQERAGVSGLGGAERRILSCGEKRRNLIKLRKS